MSKATGVLHQKYVDFAAGELITLWFHARTLG
jgi:hypothetical protein